MTTQHAAEFVFPGHPDKLCDAIADVLVQAAAQRDKRARCDVQVAVHRDAVFVTGRIACPAAETIDVPARVREVYASAGYGKEWGPAPESLHITPDLCLGPLGEGEADLRACDDQAIVTGHAVDQPGSNWLPTEHWLAYRLARRLHRLGVDEPELRLGPDGKVCVVLEEDGERLHLGAFSAALQQAPAGSEVELHRRVRATVEDELREAMWRLSGFDAALPEVLTINAAGHFAAGGLERDNGSSGNQLVADAYGPRVPIGGGALSGKDFWKAGRAGAVLARRLARAVVLTGAARACTATLAFFPGDREARVVGLRDGAGQLLLDAARWRELFDLSLAGAGERWTGVADLVEVARYGHFTEPGRPWEPIHFDRSLGGR
jgi:S-adenosylmethionine synthetase